MKVINFSNPILLPQIRIKLMLLLLLSLLMLVDQSTGAYPIPDTGQTNSYTETFGEDSDYIINPLSYTKLDANGNDLPDSATSWVMLRDNVTGLIWEVKTDDGSVHDKDNTYTWYDSNPETNGGDAGTPGDGTDTEDFINSLNAQWFGGHNDWRLPRVEELNSIYDHGTNKPAVNITFFPNTVSSRYWTSTTFAVWPPEAWASNFYSGGSPGKSDKSNGLYIRAVRGGEAVASHSFVDNGDGTVTDTSTGLMWEQTGAENGMVWESAINYCENLYFMGYADWRLPNYIELDSIVDYRTYSPSINLEYFSPIAGGYFFSSTTWLLSSEGTAMKRAFVKQKFKFGAFPVGGGENGPQIARRSHPPLETPPFPI